MALTLHAFGEREGLIASGGAIALGIMLISMTGLMLRGVGHVLSPYVVLFLGGLAAYILWLKRVFARERAVLVADGAGVFDRRILARPLPWAAIAALDVIALDGRRVLALRLAGPEAGLLLDPAIATRFAVLKQRTGYDLAISMAELSKGPRSIERAMTRLAAAHVAPPAAAPPEPPPPPAAPRAMTGAMRAAADEILVLLNRAHLATGQIHPETVIAAAAALAGERSLTATTAVAPGYGYVVSAAATELLTGDPADPDAGLNAWRIVRDHARAAGATILPDMPAILARCAAGFGQPGYPEIDVPDRHQPQGYPLFAGPRHRAAVDAIGRRHRLDPPDLALACAEAAGRMIEAASGMLPPEIAASLAACVMAGAARIAPLPADAPPLSGPQPPG